MTTDMGLSLQIRSLHPDGHARLSATPPVPHAVHLPSRLRAVHAVAGLMLTALAACGQGRSAAVAQTANGDAYTSPAGTAPGDSLSARMDRARIEGDEHAHLWFVIVSDFQCPYCRQFHDQTFDALRRQYVATGKMRIAYVNFPLPMHANAWPAAEAAMCA